MNDTETNDPTWNLLKRSKRVEPSPFFVRNVLREVRNLEPAKSGFWSGLWAVLGQRPMLAGASACAVLALVLVPLLDHSGSVSNHPGTTISYSEDQSDAFDPASEMAAIEYLGQLMAVVDPGQLDDAALADLFF